MLAARNIAIGGALLSIRAKLFLQSGGAARAMPDIRYSRTIAGVSLDVVLSKGFEDSHSDCNVSSALYGAP